MGGCVRSLSWQNWFIIKMFPAWNRNVFSLVEAALLDQEPWVKYASWENTIPDYGGGVYHFSREEVGPLRCSYEVEGLNALDIAEALDSHYGALVDKSNTHGDKVALEISADVVPVSEIKNLAQSVASMKHNLVGATLAKHFDELTSDWGHSLPPSRIRCGTEEWFVVQKSDRVVVHTSVVSRSDDAKHLTHLMLREFTTAHSAGTHAPLPAYARDSIPEDLDILFPELRDTSSSVSFLSWTFFPRHVEGQRETAVAFVLGFCQYLSYHVTSTKGHMQSIMRKRFEHYCKDIQNTYK